MPLSPAARLAPCEILAPPGAGGTGEVYKACDTRLDRIVAIKTPNMEFSGCFEREARAVAALNDPNICQLYDLGTLPEGGRVHDERGMPRLNVHDMLELGPTSRFAGVARDNVSPGGNMAVGSPLRPVETSPDITQLLIAWGGGDLGAMERLAPVLQQELHRVASAHLAAERRGHILQTTALVNETYLRLIDWKSVRWQNRAQFFAMASQMMRHILVDYARAQHREKRGGSAVHVSLSQAESVPLETAADLVALDDALQKLESFAPRQGRIVELRFFGGLSLEETAEVLEVSVGTVRRDWSLARAWLYRELNRKTP